MKEAKDNLLIYNEVKDVPQMAQKTIQAGRLKGMTDIKPMWRIEKLTEVFGPCGFGWYTETTKKEIIEGANDEKIAIVDILLYVKQGDIWSKGIEGSGGSTFVAKETKGLYTSDECFKMAYTDALSVACKSLGMGANVYWGDSKYNNKNNNETKTEMKISPKQIEILEKAYKGDNLKKLLETNGIKDIKEMPLTKANEIIKKIMNKVKSQELDAADGIAEVQDVGDR